MAVESEVGSGSRFHLSLPFLISGDRAGTGRQSEERDLPENMKVLLAEDDPTSSLFVQRSLEKAGHAVTAVTNGKKALDALREGVFDVVLMDVQMPVLDGLEAVEAIRRGDAGEGNRLIPVIALTAHAMAGDRARFLAAGMSGYAAKPVDIDELYKVLASVCGGGTRHIS